VTLVHDGDGDVPYADAVQVETAAEMLDATLSAVEGADALVSAAAISDYTVDAATEKIRSGQDDLSLELTPTPKLIDTVRAEHPDLPIVGFKAETSGDDAAMVEAARETRSRVDLAFVVANDASVMGDLETRALLVHEEGYAAFEGSKAGLGREVAASLAEVIA
jgi:phosphopantothenoylcysteine decarboxylase/phosphopantothenate--cysteine ligase